jgi:hypothetical protein
VKQYTSVQFFRQTSQELAVKRHYYFSGNEVYPENFTQIHSDFSNIIRGLEEWFAPNPIQTYTIITLAEFILLGAIDATQIKDDLFNSPPLIPKEQLSAHLKGFGIPYFEQDKQPPQPARLDICTYNAYDITGELKEKSSAIQNEKPKQSKTPLKN